MVSAEKQWIVQAPIKKGSLKNLEYFIRTGQINREKFYQWVPWSEFEAGMNRMTLEDAVKWVARKRKKYKDHELRYYSSISTFDEGRLYNVFTGEVIPFSALLN